MRVGRRIAGIERAFAVALQDKSRQHPGSGRKRDRKQKSDETEQVAESEQRKDEPHRMQSDAMPNEFRRQHVAFEELADKDYAGHSENPAPVREKLCDRDAERNH